MSFANRNWKPTTLNKIYYSLLLFVDRRFYYLAMLRSVSVQLRNCARSGVQAGRVASTLRKSIATNSISVGPQPTFVKPLSFKISHRTFFTTSRILADIKAFECPSMPESIADGGMKYLKR